MELKNIFDSRFQTGNEQRSPCQVKVLCFDVSLPTPANTDCFTVYTISSFALVIIPIAATGRVAAIGCVDTKSDPIFKKYKFEE